MRGRLAGVAVACVRDSAAPEKSREKVEESYLPRVCGARRGDDVTMRWVRGSRRYTIGELYDQLQHSLAHWPLPVMRLQYEQVMAACSLFRPRHE